MRSAITATVNSGAVVSDVIDLRELGGIRSISVPANVTSGQLLIQAAPDTTSASFARVQKAPPNSGDLQFSVVGSVALGVLLSAPDELRAPGFSPYARIELSAAQIATRTFTLYAARW